MDVDTVYEKREHFTKIVRDSIDKELLCGSTDFIKLKVDSMVNHFNVKANEYIISSLLKLEIDPDIVRKQIIVIKELKEENNRLKEENDKLKEENEELRYENSNWKSLAVPTFNSNRSL